MKIEKTKDFVKRNKTLLAVSLGSAVAITILSFKLIKCNDLAGNLDLSDELVKYIKDTKSEDLPKFIKLEKIG